MSKRFEGGIDYSRVKRHYDADDYVALPFTLAQDYYIVGLMAFFNDVNVADLERGWTKFEHGRSSAPAWLIPVLNALIPTLTGDIKKAAQTIVNTNRLPVEMTAFEAKDLLFLATEDCWVQFEGPNRVQHLIPAGDYIRFHRRCLMFFFSGVSSSGNLKVWLEG